jgi:hypothetical protein
MAKFEDGQFLIVLVVVSYFWKAVAGEVGKMAPKDLPRSVRALVVRLNDTKYEESSCSSITCSLGLGV